MLMEPLLAPTRAKYMENDNSSTLQIFTKAALRNVRGADSPVTPRGRRSFTTRLLSSLAKSSISGCKGLIRSLWPDAVEDDSGSSTESSNDDNKLTYSPPRIPERHNATPSVELFDRNSVTAVQHVIDANTERRCSGDSCSDGFQVFQDHIMQSMPFHTNADSTCSPKIGVDDDIQAGSSPPGTVVAAEFDAEGGHGPAVCVTLVDIHSA